MELVQQFEKVYIDRESLESPLAQRIQKLFAREKVQIVDAPPTQNSQGLLSAEAFDRSKREIFITPFRGQFFKRCPGASQKRALTCCNYHVLNLGLQCNMNCSYCYLQSYLNTSILTLYSNIEDALNEMATFAKESPTAPYRIGTGEVMDSLSMDTITLFSKTLIAFFRDYPHWTLEFKTKSHCIEQFIDEPHVGNITVGWSLNPQEVITSEEHQTASLEERLDAAKRCVQKGFQISFHLDPMVWHPNWKDNYIALVREIQNNFTPGQVSTISLGALRFQPEQRHMMRERFGYNSMVNRAEMFPSRSGKLRYDQNLRNEMFQTVINEFRAHSPEWKVFLCMESPESWIENYKASPMQIDALKPLFRPLPRIKVPGSDFGS